MVALAVEVIKVRFNATSNVATTQVTRSRADIKPLVLLARETFVILSFLSGRPRFRVLAQPYFAFGLPLPLEGQWNGIAESERNEISCANLCPMWQVALCNAEVSTMIKAAKGQAPRTSNADTPVRALRDIA